MSSATHWSILKKPNFWAVFIIIFFVLSGVATLGNYSLSWDEGLGNLFFGERYFHFFISGDPTYLDFENGDLAIHQRPLNLFLSAYKQPHEFPPVADTVSALAMEMLAYRLGWMDPVDAFHLPKILLSGLLLWVLYRFAAPRLGNFAALLGILILGMYPRFWGDMHFNPKDIPITAFFAFVIVGFLNWYEDGEVHRRPSRWKALGVGLLAGAALSIKANAVFLPLVIILGIWPWQRRWPPWKQVVDLLRRRYWDYLIMLGAALAFHVASWPYLYADPIGRLVKYYQYIYSQGERGGLGKWNLDPLIQAFTTTPEVVLALLLVGIVYAILRVVKGEQNLVFRLLLAWLAVPIFRNSLPNTVNFDGIRHFEEYLPAACLLTGYGAAQLVGLLARKWPGWRAALQAGLAGLVLVSLAAIHWHYHPYPYIFYNSLVGGLSGAHFQKNFPEATDYWAVSYRQGIAWLNANAEPGASVAAPIAQWNLRLTAPLWMRPDLKYLVERRVDQAISNERTVYLMFINREEYFTPIAHYCVEKSKPIHQIFVDGVPILSICRLGPSEAAEVQEFLSKFPAEDQDR